MNYEDRAERAAVISSIIAVVVLVSYAFIFGKKAERVKTHKKKPEQAA